MNTGLAMSIASLLGTLFLGYLSYRNYKRANDVQTKATEVQAQAAIDARASMIAKETADELTRLYKRVDKLEQIVEELQKRDRQKQATIEDQAAELDRTNGVLAAVRSLFVAYAARVERAWRDGHAMPVLTAEERAILEDSPHIEEGAQKWQRKQC